MKQFELEKIKVGILLGSWSKMVCPNCETVNWANVHGNVVDVIHCHKCSGYFWPDATIKDILVGGNRIKINPQIYEGKNLPEGEDFPEIVGEA